MIPEEPDRHVASFLLAPEILEQAIHLPEGHRIFGVEWDFPSRAIRLYVEGPNLPLVEYGYPVSHILPIITRTKDADDGEVRYTWDWNLQPSDSRGPQ